MEVVAGPGEGGRLVTVPGGPAEAVAGVAGEAAQLLEAAAGELVREGRRRQQPRHLVQPRQQQLLLLVEEGVGGPRPELGVTWRTGEVTSALKSSIRRFVITEKAPTRVSIVSYSSLSLMIIASWTQFHIESPSRGLLRDCTTGSGTDGSICGTTRDTAGEQDTIGENDISLL